MWVTERVYAMANEIFTIFTARIRRMGEGNSFSLLVCPHPGEGGTYPGQVQMGGGPQGIYPPPKPGQDEEKGVPQGTYPTGQVRMGRGTPRYLAPWPGQDGGRGYPKVGTPPPSQGLATRRAVCLLRSCRRIFLFSVILRKWISR